MDPTQLDAPPIEPRLFALADESRAFYAARGTGPGPQSAAEVHRLREQRMADPRPRDPRAVDLTAEWAGRAVTLRVITPEVSARGVVLDLHGGGFYLGSAADHDSWNRALSDALDAVVVGVDYRLAPEHPWPAAPDDCEVAARWLVENATAQFGTDRLVLVGFSAGSTLAMTTLLRLRETGLADRFCGAALHFGTYDLSSTTPAGRLIADEYFLEAYVGHVVDRTLPDISPLFGTLSGLPPMTLVVGSEDVLLDDNTAMAQQLSRAGNDVDLRVYPASPHGFTHHATSMAAVARHDISAWLAERLTA